MREIGFGGLGGARGMASGARGWMARLAGRASVALGLIVVSATAASASFTPGSIVVYRLGDGSTTTVVSGSTGPATPVFLDEYSPAGVLLQSIALPTAAGTAPLTYPLTASGNASEGEMTRTVDGSCLTLTGYLAASGTATPGSSKTIPRGVAFVNTAGAVDTTTSLGTLAFEGSNIRGAASDTCQHVWASGNGSAATNYGVWYAQKGASTATQVDNVNAQGIVISNGQLYASLSGLEAIGSGLPNTAGQTATALSSSISTADNYRGIAFLQLQSASTGNDTLYLMDNSANLISKFYFNGTAWVAAGSLSVAGISGVNATGLMAVNLGDGEVALYFTSSKGGIIYRAFDLSGPTGSLASTTAYTSFATAAGQPTYATYAGLAPSPESALPTAVPAAPTNAVASNVSATAFTVNWTAPASGAAVQYYVLDVASDSAFASVVQTILVPAGTTTANISGLTSTTVYYRIRAVNDLGGSADLVSGVNVPQTITFGNPPTLVVAGTGVVTATASSGLPVVYSSQTPNVCSVTGNVVTGLSVGTCTIAADQAGNNEYVAAVEVSQSIAVSASAQSQSISFGTAPSVTVGSSATLSATASSGLAVTFSSTTPLVCTVSGATVNGLGAGTCTVVANQPGNANYFAATPVTQSFAISPASQSIAFGSAPTVVVGGSATLTATATSGLAVVYASTTPAVCTVSGSSVTGVTVGTCTVTADQPGNGNYTAAAQAQQSFAVGAAPQAISFQTVPADVVGASATLAATASSGLPVVYSSTTPSVCTVNANVVTGVAQGTCVIAADQSGSTNFLAAPTATQSFTVAKPLAGFTPGSLIISTVTNVNNSGANLDTAVPIVLQQFALSSDGTSATLSGALILPEGNGGSQGPVSGEYGSASEGHLQPTVNGQYLLIMGYGVDATTFNSASLATYGSAALGQSTSLTAANQSGTAVTTVPRVVARIGIDGSVDTSTALTGVYNQNNPRSVASVDGSAFYTSGQGAAKGDVSEGVQYALFGATTAVPIDTSTETRMVEILNNGSGNTLYVSRDMKPVTGANIDTNIGTLTDANGNLPTSATGLISNVLVPGVASVTGGNNASIDLTAATANGVNNARIGSFVYLSPEQFFLASPTVMYVADSGQPKDGSANAAGIGAGGLQKWILVNGVWTLAYDLVNGLNLVNNANANAATPTAPGVTGLISLVGQVVQGQVHLYAATYGLNELSQSYLVEITDDLAATSISQVANEQFVTLYTDPTGQTLIRGVSFAPGLQQSIAAVSVPALAAGGSAALSASASSGLAVSYASLTPAVCTVSGSLVTGVAAGTCTIAVDQAGNAQYSPAIEVTASTVVGASLLSQTISFGASPVISVGATAPIVASASSGLSVTITSQTPAVCSVSGSTVSALSAGTCTITADQGGNGVYGAATEASISFSVAPALQSQSISFGAAPSLSVGGIASLSATASSGLVVGFTSLTPAVCSVSGTSVSGLTAGTCTIAADQSGSSQYSAATEVTESFTVADGTGTSGGASTDSGEVPLPPWAYALLGLLLMAALRHSGLRRR